LQKPNPEHLAATATIAELRAAITAERAEHIKLITAKDALLALAIQAATPASAAGW
jgi:hypothetical protein